MKRFGLAFTAAVFLFPIPPTQAGAQPPRGSTFLANVSWLEASTLLTEDAIVVITSGNASKEHGPHLPLSTDFIQAEYVKDQVARRTSVTVAPSVGYGFYPPFVEYPGSTTLPLSVARDMVAHICRSYARSSNARRFYIISHGGITKPVFEEAATLLAAEGILLRFTDWEAAKRAAIKGVTQQEKGSHADEVETSMMLYIAPAMVDMTKAVKEFGTPSGKGYMIGNRPANIGVFSPSGVYGDPTLATREKGRRITEAVVDAALKDIERLRSAPLPRTEPLDALFAGLDGQYEITPGDTVTVGRDGDMLAVQRTGTPRMLLQRAGKHRFGLWTTEARFFADARGTVTHLMLSVDGRDLLATRIK